MSKVNSHYESIYLENNSTFIIEFDNPDGKIISIYCDYNYRDNEEPYEIANELVLGTDILKSVRSYGTIVPEEYFKCKTLQQLILYHCILIYPDDEDKTRETINNLSIKEKSFKNIHFVQHKMLTSSFPSIFFKYPENYPNLTSLVFKYCNINDKIPQEIGNMVQLKELNLKGNELYDSIPKEIGKLVNLRYLNLSCNYLSGNIPEELSKCKNISKINVSRNINLSGIVPHSILKLNYLSIFDSTETRLDTNF